MKNVVTIILAVLALFFSVYNKVLIDKLEKEVEKNKQEANTWIEFVVESNSANNQKIKELEEKQENK